MAEYNDLGQEVPDKTPVAVPLRRRNVNSETARIKGLIREAMSEAAVKSGAESWEESNDFDVGDNDDDRLFSAYEVSDMQDERPVGELTEKLGPAKVPPANPGKEGKDNGRGKEKSDGVERDGKNARSRKSKDDGKDDAGAARPRVESGDQEDSSKELE